MWIDTFITHFSDPQRAFDNASSLHLGFVSDERSFLPLHPQEVPHGTMVATDCARPACRVARLSVVMIFELTPARFEFQVDVEEKLFLTKLHNLSRTLNCKRDDTDDDSGSACEERESDESLSPLLSLTFSSLCVQLGPATGDRARNRMGDPRK